MIELHSKNKLFILVTTDVSIFDKSNDFNDKHPLNNSFIFLIFFEKKLLKSKEVNEEHPQNNESISVTKDVLIIGKLIFFNYSHQNKIFFILYNVGVIKFDKFSDVIDLQSLNIFSIDLVFNVSKLDKSNDINEVQPSNIEVISVTADVLTLLKLIFFKLIHL